MVVAQAHAKEDAVAAFDLVAATVHELKNPITLIKGLATMLESGQFGELNPEQARYLNRIIRANERMLNLTEGLLAMAQSNQDQPRLMIEPLAVDKVLSEVLDELNPEITKHEITVNYVNRQALPPILADKIYLRQIFINLLDNALKYSPMRTTITITLKKAEQLVIKISDQGIGIKPNDIAHLFKRFSKRAEPIHAYSGSSGLGLFIVKNLVELHGGSVSVAPKARGSCFTVKLPIATQLALFKA